MTTKTIQEGCVMDGAVPRSQKQVMLKLVDLLADCIDSQADENDLEFWGEYEGKIVDMINELLPEHLHACWEAGDFLILDHKSQA